MPSSKGKPYTRTELKARSCSPLQVSQRKRKRDAFGSVLLSIYDKSKSFSHWKHMCKTTPQLPIRVTRPHIGKFNGQHYGNKKLFARTVVNPLSALMRL